MDGQGVEPEEDPNVRSLKTLWDLHGSRILQLSLLLQLHWKQPRDENCGPGAAGIQNPGVTGRVLSPNRCIRFWRFFSDEVDEEDRNNLNMSFVHNWLQKLLSRSSSAAASQYLASTRQVEASCGRSVVAERRLAAQHDSSPVNATAVLPLFDGLSCSKDLNMSNP
ncbi:unnamed protein product [Pleuronectes platessa]|uniref:Uncharacterized protein n=1 Tax=Pleuronectes platessa TaxID=8262 RepID=A0A9N7UPN4_PLEPL|nr:unnamed protein product [Pleuronectes platessa]